MPETLGSLVDRLSVANLKLWFVQEKVNEAAAAGKPLSAEHTKQLVGLNLVRNRLMTEIDLCLDRAAKEGKAEVDPRVKL